MKVYSRINFISGKLNVVRNKVEISAVQDSLLLGALSWHKVKVLSRFSNDAETLEVAGVLGEPLLVI